MDLIKTKIIDWTNKSQVLNAVKGNKNALQYATYFHDDKDVVLAAVKCNGLQIKYASDKLKNDPEIVFEAVKNNGEALGLVDRKFAQNKRYMLEALKTAPYAFMLDENLVKFAIESNLIDNKDYSIIVDSKMFINKIKNYYGGINTKGLNETNVLETINNGQVFNNEVDNEVKELLIYLSYINCKTVKEFYLMLSDFISQRETTTNAKDKVQD